MRVLADAGRKRETGVTLAHHSRLASGAGREAGPPDLPAHPHGQSGGAGLSGPQGPLMSVPQAISNRRGCRRRIQGGSFRSDDGQC